MSGSSDFERVSSGTRDLEKESSQTAYNPGLSPARVGGQLEPEELTRSQAAIAPWPILETASFAVSTRSGRQGWLSMKLV